MTSSNQISAILILHVSSTIGVPSGVKIAQLASCLNAQSVPGSILVPRSRTSKIYERLNYQWNTVNNIRPLAYLIPESTLHVQEAIRCGRSLRIRMVTKSGGHSYEKYSFGDADAVVIDLRNMSSILVDKNSSTAVIGPGLLMAQLYYYAWKDGFVTPGGLCLSVGYGGAALGGGYGYVSKKYGLMADNVLEMETVTAQGHLVTTNAIEHPDLFWALRGAGGGNFGIVTKLKIQLHNASNLTYTITRLNYRLDQFVEAFDAFQKVSLHYVNASVLFLAGMSQNGFAISFFDVNLPEREKIEIIKKLPVPIRNSTKSFSELIEIAQLELPPGTNVSHLRDYDRLGARKQFAKVKSYFVNKVVPLEDVVRLGQVVSRIPKKVGAGFTSFGGAINRVAKDATAFVHRNALYKLQVRMGSNNSEVVAWVNEVKVALQALDSGESYQNYVDGTLDDYLERYYGPNLGRLKEIKRNYDPDNYFRFPQSIPPAAFGKSR